jgi:hypothetical protein
MRALSFPPVLHLFRFRSFCLSHFALSSPDRALLSGVGSLSTQLATVALTLFVYNEAAGDYSQV